MARFDEDKTKKAYRDGFIDHYSRILSKPLTKFIVTKTNLTANHVTTISLFLATLSAFFYAFPIYRNLVIGSILLFSSQIFDYSDGEVARYRGTQNKFGRWYDEITDVLKYIFIVSGITYGLYFKSNSVIVIVLGALAIIHIILFNYIRQSTKVNITENAPPELPMGKNLYFGITVTTVYLIIIFSLLNQLYYFLWIYATLGVFLWLKKIHSGFKLGRKLQDKLKF